MLVRNKEGIAQSDIVRNDILRLRIRELADRGCSPDRIGPREVDMDCPEYLEIEELIMGSDLTVRIPRTTAETSMGRRFMDRTDFMQWVEAHRSELLHKAFEKSLIRAAYPVGADPTIVLEPGDLEVEG